MSKIFILSLIEHWKLMLAEASFKLPLNFQVLKYLTDCFDKGYSVGSKIIVDVHNSKSAERI